MAAPLSGDAAGEDAGGADGVALEALELSGVGAIPSSVLPRAAPALGFIVELDETRTAGGRDVTPGRSDAGVGPSGAAFGRSEDFGISAEVHASSISSVGAGANDGGAEIELGPEALGRHEGSRDGLLSAGSPLILQHLSFGGGA